MRNNSIYRISFYPPYINGSATNIKLEAAKEYDLNTQTGTMKGTNLTVEGTANMTVTGGIVKINS